MATKLTTERVEIGGGNMPLKERKKSSMTSSLAFWGVFTRLHVSRAHWKELNSLSPIASLCEDSQVSQ